MSDALRDAARAALDALETCTPADYSTGHVIHADFDAAKCAAAEEALRAALAAAPEQPAEPKPIGEVVIGEDGMTKGWTVIKWRADLPPVAVGTKLYDRAPVWISRFHHLMKKHGMHPGRTDDDLLDILDAHLSAAPPAPAPIAQPQPQPQDCSVNDLVAALVDLDECYCEAGQQLSRERRNHHRQVLMKARRLIVAHGIGAQEPKP